MAKVFVFGIDGGTFNVIDSLIKEGELPNFAKIVRGGTKALLRSTVPAITLPAWPSMFTGCNPGKHGLYGFEFLDKNFNARFTSAKNLRTKTLWQLASACGRRTIAIDVPGTYPPPEINGIVISGSVLNLNSNFVHPYSAWEELFRVVPGYKLEPTAVDGYGSESRLLEFMAECHENLRQRAQLAKHFMRKEWDLFFIVFNATDRLQHIFWRFLDSGHPDYVFHERLRDAIPEGYKILDALIGEITSDPGIELLVVSDHGFGPVDRILSVKDIVYDLRGLSGAQVPDGGNLFTNSDLTKLTPEGNLAEFSFGAHGSSEFSVERMDGGRAGCAVLTTKERDSFVDIRQEFKGLDPGHIYRLGFHAKGNSGSLLEVLELQPGVNERSYLSIILGEGEKEIDIELVPSSADISIAVRNSSFGGYPAGSIRVWAPSLVDLGPVDSLDAIAGISPFVYIPDRRRYHECRERTARYLSSLRCDDFQPSGLFESKNRSLGWKPSLFEKVHTKESLYHGWALEDAPDLVYELNSRTGMRHRHLKRPPQGWSGHHRPEGIFLAYGGRIRKMRAGPFDIMDITPTVLHMLGCAVPKYIDGRVITEMLVESGPVNYVELKGEVGAAGGMLSEEEEKTLETRLRNLGYLG